MAPLSNLVAALKSSRYHALEGRTQESSLMAAMYMPAPSFERAFSRVSAALTQKELRFKQLVAASKARAKDELRGLIEGTALSSPPPKAPAPQSSTSAAPTPEQLEAMYGSDGWLRSTVLSVVGNASHMFMHRANTINMSGQEILHEAMQRPSGQALITVSNHVAALDDPLVVAAILPTDVYSQPSALRWTLCASERCFKYASLSRFFTAAKVLPVERGAGMKQPGMIAAEARLAQGDWVHIFPEGTRARDPTKFAPVRKGVGRLVAAAAAAAPPGTPAPMVVPFVHAGMENIMPVGSKLPTVGNQIHVLVGTPIPVDDLLRSAQETKCTDEQLYTAIAARVERHMQHLHRKVQRLALGQPEDVEDRLPTNDNPLQRPGPSALAAQGRPWWPQTASYSTSPRSFWGPVQQRNWEHAVFGTWHRAWAAQIAASTAGNELNAQAVQ